MDILNKIFKALFVTPERIGERGEKKIANKIGALNLFEKTGKILKNIYVPKEDGSTAEIDVLYITEKGLIVIESKNYSRYIFGNEDKRSWVKTLYAGKTWYGKKKIEKYRFYNPIWQNNSHIKSLKRYLNTCIQMFSVIVFSNQCEIKELSVERNDVFICQERDLSFVIKNIFDSYPSILDNLQICSIYEALKPLSSQDKAIRDEHIAGIIAKQESNEICPLCGGQLVLRTARQGTNAGHQFVGCSNYPRCRYTKNP